MPRYTGKTTYILLKQRNDCLSKADMCRYEMLFILTLLLSIYTEKKIGVKDSVLRMNRHKYRLGQKQYYTRRDALLQCG